MMRTLLLPIALSFACGTQAQLGPCTEAPIAAHLLEVNAQWSQLDPMALGSTAPTSFHNDTERIATHLYMVHDRLLERMPEGLSADQQTKRMRSLERLTHYANDQRFPKNNILPYRNPVFIDPNGTACAVGWLMIESGHHALAEEISTSMNLAYVLEMPGSPQWPAISSWAMEHGFNAEELAWIQPGYAPNIPWIALGGGTNGPVHVLHSLANGELLVAGDFTEAGGVLAQRVAIWDGDNYIALGGGLQGEVACAVEFEGSIYVGGMFLNGPEDLARWDGTSWSFSTVFDGKLPRITALHVHDGRLHAAGSIMGFAGETFQVMHRENEQWSVLGDPFNDQIFAMTTFNNELVAGGAFTQPVSEIDPLMLRVARYDGFGWAQLADGLDAVVRCFAQMDGKLYAGGDLYAAEEEPAFGLARIAPLADTWEHLLPNHPIYMPLDEEWSVQPKWIAALAVQDDALYFGGEFPLFEGFDVVGSHVGQFHAPDQTSVLAPIFPPVHALAMYDWRLVRGGEFWSPIPYVAITDMTMGTGPSPGMPTTTMCYPNPAEDQLVVVLPEGMRDLRAWVVTNVQGQRVSPPTVGTGDGLRIDVSALAAGMYQVTMLVDEHSMTTTFLKE